jgi:hypothetical protein
MIFARFGCHAVKLSESGGEFQKKLKQPEQNEREAEDETGFRLQPCTGEEILLPPNK